MVGSNVATVGDIGKSREGRAVHGARAFAQLTCRCHPAFRELRTALLGGTCLGLQS